MLVTERYESMSPKGLLRLFRQEDGDIVITVVQDDGDGDCTCATIEFCTPFGGGGGSSRTYDALIQLAAAMAADNLDVSQSARSPQWIDDDEQKRLVQWGKDVLAAKKEFGLSEL